MNLSAEAKTVNVKVELELFAVLHEFNLSVLCHVITPLGRYCSRTYAPYTARQKIRTMLPDGGRWALRLATLLFADDPESSSRLLRIRSSARHPGV
ncbi:hypothetical protein R50076_17640 [Gilvimarinus japonicus]